MLSQSLLIMGSVGPAPIAKNRRSDVEIVHRLLNQHAQWF